jgi:hypothetical protein
MARALNLTFPLKQDPQAQEDLKQLTAVFAQTVQPAIDAAFLRSQIVHFARILVIENKYLLVLIESDGDPKDYTEFFRKELGPVFQAIFSLAEGAPRWDELNNPNAFYEFVSGLNIASLGSSTAGDGDRGGYLFSAVGNKTVRELQAALSQSGSNPGAAGARSGVTGA